MSNLASIYDVRHYQREEPAREAGSTWSVRPAEPEVARGCRVVWLPVLFVFAFLFQGLALCATFVFRMRFGGFTSSFAMCVSCLRGLGREVVYHVSRDVQSQASCCAVVTGMIVLVVVRPPPET